MNVPEIIGTTFILLGALILFVGAVGIVRFPGFYARLHAAGKGDTMGQGLIILGLFVVTVFDAEGTWNDAFKLLVIAFFVFILNATATHALARAGWLAGLLPWTRETGEMPSQSHQFEGQMTDEDRVAVIVPVQAAPDEPPPAASEPSGGDAPEAGTEDHS